MDDTHDNEERVRPGLGGSAEGLLIERTPLAVIEWDPQFRVRAWNPAAERIFGYSRNEVIGQSAECILPLDMRAHVGEVWRQLLAGTGGTRSTNRNTGKHGRQLHCEWFNTVLRDDTGELIGALSLVQDVTERHQAELALRRQKNLYQALSETNHMITRARGISEIFTEACEIAVHYGDFRLAWIGYVDPDTLWIEPLAWHGASEGYLEHLKVSVDPSRPEGSGPSGCAIKQDRYVIVDDFLAGAATQPWHAAAQTAGLRSSAAFPLRRGGRAVAVFNVYADDVDYFRPDLLALLEEIAGDISFAMDNLDREAQRRSAEAERDRLVAILEATPDFVSIAGPDGVVLYHNAGARKMLGLEVDTDAGDRHVGDSHPDSAARVIQEEAFPTALREGIWQGESVMLTADGREVPVSQIILAHRNGRGKVTHLSTIARDISALKYAQAQVQHLAYYDGLTGLPNRRLLKDRLHRDINRARRNGLFGAVLHVDLDRLKTVNDSLGHVAGDLLLQETAKRMVGSLRGEDSVARASADEFMIVLAECGNQWEDAANTAQTVAELVQERIAQPYLIDGTEIHVSASIGIALFPTTEYSVDAVLRRAETAKHRAKAHGGNAIQFFEPQMQVAAEQRLRLEKDMRQALQRDELCLNFQPQVDLTDGRVVGAEALLSWQHPERGLIPPGEFIPVAEETGLILSIGEWVMCEALTHIKRWLDLGVCGSMGSLAVNVSPRQFREPQFVGQVAGALEKIRVPGSCLKLEITESVVLEDIGDAIEKMHALKELGVGVAIDDFGTGYSSLAYLRQLPLDTLKLDKSFIDRVTSDPRDASIVETILTMARHLGLHVIAEGVETQAQARFLSEKGCPVCQGYYFSRPLAAERLADLLAGGTLPI